MEKFLPALLEKMQTATSYSALIQMIQCFMKEHGRKPVLVFILTLLIKTINFNFKINQLRPVRRAAFIISWGFTNKFLSHEMNIIRPIPFTGWFYSGRSNVVLNSRTIIIDPYPFSIKTLTGRQGGLMVNFMGVYIHQCIPIADNAITFFFGYAKTIRGFDLSPECL